MHRKIKIVHILEQLGVGGKEKFVINLCNHLNPDFFEIYLISLTNSDLTLKNTINSYIKLICLDYQNPDDIQRSKRFFKSFSSLVFPLIKIFTTIKPDIVHSHNNYLSLLFVSFACRIASQKTLFFQTIHITNNHFANNALKYRFIAMLERLALAINRTYLISISTNTYHISQEYYRNVSLENRLIFSGIDTSRCNKLNYSYVSRRDFHYSDKDIIAVYVARMDENKNHEIIVRAWKELYPGHNNLKLIFVGDGPARIRLEKLVNEFGLNEVIRFTGLVDNVYEYLSISDIGIISSLSEAFPLVLLEKMNMGLPIIASDIPIFQELIISGENGYLFDPSNVVELVEKVEYLYSNKSERIKLGLNAACTGVKFSIIEMAKNYDLYYLDVYNLYNQ